MHNSQAQTHRNFAIRQGAMRELYDEGTGSVIDERSDPFQGVPRMWDLLSPGASYSHAGRTATTGACLVIIQNRSNFPEVVAVREFDLEAVLPAVVLSPASILDRVRTVFGLNISETAAVFGITRQTAYQWMNFTDMAQVRSRENRDRLKQLFDAAQFWQDQPQLKGSWLYAVLPAGNTVLDLLKEYQVNLEALKAAYLALSASMAGRRREEGGRATQAATALVGAFTGLGAGRKVRKG